MEPFNTPGLAALSHEGCIFEVGAVAASVSRETMQELVDAYYWVSAHKEASEADFVAAPAMHKSQWLAIGWVRERNSYSLNLRGVAWEVYEPAMKEFVELKALPFLARGTTDVLLSKMNIEESGDES